MNEDLSGLGQSEPVGRHTAVGAADQHVLGTLALAQVAEIIGILADHLRNESARSVGAAVANK